ncbi:hypothetical protein [Ureaplasma zalophigenitalium]|uniref:Uncharacterized protein n=1 Tax=Ureaplasma zalophigenitalium TaxID=907723 RepID=A0ABT3BP69_9BACT|nr:hypothetical protein [Ureaplasma zalophigenitalium]MCV3754058.1 hypothetical protein [Ureaplasma zalophigenitalium]
MKNQNSNKKRRKIAAAYSVVSSLFMAGVVITATQLRWNKNKDHTYDETGIEYRKLLEEAKKTLKLLIENNNLNYENLIDDLKKNIQLNSNIDLKNSERVKEAINSLKRKISNIKKQQDEIDYNYKKISFDSGELIKKAKELLAKIDSYQQDDVAHQHKELLTNAIASLEKMLKAKPTVLVNDLLKQNELLQGLITDCENYLLTLDNKNDSKNKLLQEIQTLIAKINDKNQGISNLYQVVKDKINSVTSEFNRLVPNVNDLSNVSLEVLEAFKNKLIDLLNNIDPDILKISQDNLLNASNNIQDYINELKIHSNSRNYVDIINRLEETLKANQVPNSDVLMNEKQTKNLLDALDSAKTNKLNKDTELKNSKETLISTIKQANTLKDQLTDPALVVEKNALENSITKANTIKQVDANNKEALIADINQAKIDLEKAMQVAQNKKTTIDQQKANLKEQIINSKQAITDFLNNLTPPEKYAALKEKTNQSLTDLNNNNLNLDVKTLDQLTSIDQEYKNLLAEAKKQKDQLDGNEKTAKLTELNGIKEQLKQKVAEIDSLKNNGKNHIDGLNSAPINEFLSQTDPETVDSINQAIIQGNQLLQQADKNIYADKLNTIKKDLESLAQTEDLAKKYPDINNQLTGFVSAISTPVDPDTLEAYKTRYEEHKEDVAKIKEAIKQKQENEQQTKQRLVQEIQELLNQADTKNQTITATYQTVKDKIADLRPDFNKLVPNTTDLSNVSIASLETFKTKVKDVLDNIQAEILNISKSNLNTAVKNLDAFIDKLQQNPKSKNYVDIINQLNETLKANRTPASDTITNEKQTESLKNALEEAKKNQLNKDNEFKVAKDALLPLIEQANTLKDQLTDPALTTEKTNLENALNNADKKNKVDTSGKEALIKDINKAKTDLEVAIQAASAKKNEIDKQRESLKNQITDSKKAINNFLNTLTQNEKYKDLFTKTNQSLTDLNNNNVNLDVKTLDQLTSIDQEYKNLLAEAKKQKDQLDGNEKTAKLTELNGIKEQLKQKVAEIDSLKNNGKNHIDGLNSAPINEFLSQTDPETVDSINQAIIQGNQLLQQADKNIYADKLNTIKKDLESLAQTEDLAKKYPDINNQLTGFVSAISTPVDPDTLEAYKTRYEEHKEDVAKIKEAIKQKQENEQQTKQRLVQEIQELLNQADTKNQTITNIYQSVKDKINSLPSKFAKLLPDKNDLSNTTIKTLESFKDEAKNVIDNIDTNILKISEENLKTAANNINTLLNELEKNKNTKNYTEIIDTLKLSLKTNSHSANNYLTNEAQTKKLEDVLKKAKADQKTKDNEFKIAKDSLSVTISRANTLKDQLTDPALTTEKTNLENALNNADKKNKVDANGKEALIKDINKAKTDLEVAIQAASAKKSEIDKQKADKLVKLNALKEQLKAKVAEIKNIKNDNKEHISSLNTQAIEEFLVQEDPQTIGEVNNHLSHGNEILEQADKNIYADKLNAIKKDLESLAQAEDLPNKFVDIDAEVKNLIQTIKSPFNPDTVDAHKERYNEHVNDVEKIKRKIAEAKDELANKRNNLLKNIEKIIEGVNAKNASLSSTYSSSKNKLESLNNEFNQLKNDFSNKTVHDLETFKTKAQKTLDSIDEEVLQTSKNNLSAAVSNLNNRLSELNANPHKKIMKI